MSQPKRVMRHGTHTRYSKGCRCDSCRTAHRIYERNRTRQVRRERQGIEPRVHRFVSTDEAKEHLLFLRSKGIGLTGISIRSGVDRSSLQQIVAGRKKKILAVNAGKILAVPAIHNLPGQFVPADEAKRLIAELRARGYYVREIAARLGQQSENITLRKTVRLKRLEAIRLAHAELMRYKPR